MGIFITHEFEDDLTLPTPKLQGKIAELRAGNPNGLDAHRLSTLESELKLRRQRGENN